MRLIGGVLGLVLVGCINPGAEPAAVPLHSDADVEQKGTATLIGDVQSVDGKRVGDQGKRFTLAAGCHTVTNVTTWGGASSDEAVMAKLPEIPFAVDMVPGKTYVLRIFTPAGGANGGDLQITLVEQDGDGSVTREFKPGTSC